MKKCLRLYTKAGTWDWISQVAHDWQAARGCTRVKHAEKLGVSIRVSVSDSCRVEVGVFD